MAILEGSIWLTDNGANRLVLEQIDLLQAVEASGSISAAAKMTGISYKTAWDRLQRLNNLSKSPLVNRSTGGNKGGGTCLTAYGLQLLAGFSELKEQHQLFLQTLSNQLTSLDDVAGFIKRTSVQTSAQNQFVGVISSLQTDGENSEVLLQLSDDLPLVAIVTQSSQEELGLDSGDSVLAMIKASAITLGLGEKLEVSARNKFKGKISRLERGAVNTEVSIDLGSSKTLCAMITNHSADQLALRESQTVTAFFKASSVVLMRL